MGEASGASDLTTSDLTVSRQVGQAGGSSGAEGLTSNDLEFQGQWGGASGLTTSDLGSRASKWASGPTTRDLRVR